MKRFIIMIGTALLVILTGGAAYFHFIRSPVTEFVNAASVQHQWANVDHVTGKSVGHLLQVLKKGNKITSISATTAKDGDLELQVEMTKTLTSKERLKLSRQLLLILFINPHVHQIVMTTTKAGPHNQIIQLAASRKGFMTYQERKNKNSLAGGLQQFLVINKKG